MTATAASVRLKFGLHDHEVLLPDGCGLEICAPKRAPGLPRPEEAVRASLRSPVGSRPLRERARGAGSAAILISARDRVTGSDCFVKVIADELNAAQIPDEAIRVFLATGTHQKQTDQDVRSLLGPEAFDA